MTFRLTKNYKLQNSQDFGRVFEQTDLKVSTPSMLVLATNTSKCCARLGLVISKKNVGCAVARNRIKRLCREAFRLNTQRLPKMDLVFLAKSGISSQENHEITTMINKLINQLITKILPAQKT